MRHETIPLGKLFVSALNTRKVRDAGQEDSGIAELADSIRQQGLLNPLLVRPAQEGRYEVIAGQRRLLACQEIGHDPVPCLVRDGLDDSDAVVLSLVENVHRADMHPLDKARALKELYDRYGSYERVAKETTWSASTVRKYVQLRSLPDELQERISTAEGPARVAALAKLAQTFTGDEAVEVYERIAGFRQSIQGEIIKQSGGDLSKIAELVERAQEGAFDTRFCGGSFRCGIIRDIIEGSVKMDDFQQLVREVADNVGSELAQASLREAARDFWRALAR